MAIFQKEGSGLGRAGFLVESVYRTGFPLDPRAFPGENLIDFYTSNTSFSDTNLSRSCGHGEVV